MARSQGAIAVNYDEDDPVEALKDASNGYGPDACIDAVGVDAQRPHHGPAKKRESLKDTVEYLLEQRLVAPRAVSLGDQWRQGDGPSQVLMWCVDAVRKSAVVSVIGVYPPNARFFPIGLGLQKALTLRAAVCSHRKYIPKVIQLIEESGFRPSTILTKMQPLDEAVDSYKHFDKREPGWMKVEILPQDWHGTKEEKTGKPSALR
jgi:threonine dehydrogenase-like Zn-dependent dehydrogenase